MIRISIAALLAAAWANAAPVYAQDVPASAELSVLAHNDTTFDIDTGLDIAISTEQTAQIRHVVESNFEPVTVDFDAAIGATVPSTVTLSPLPAEIVAIVPALKGYLLFLLPDRRIVIVSPSTLRVVLVIYA